MQYPIESEGKRKHLAVRVCTGHTEVGYSPPL